MDINRARALMSKLEKLETGGGRYDAKPGIYWVLINKVSLEESRDFKPYLKLRLTILRALQDEAGRVPTDEGYAGSHKGEDISTTFFYGDRFQRDFGPFLCAAMNISADAAKDVSKDDLKELALSILSCEGQEVGCLDGHTVIQMRAVTSAPVKKEENGKEVLKTYVNERFDRRVLLSELAEYLDDDDVVRFFNSSDRFAEMLIAEESE